MTSMVARVARAAYERYMDGLINCCEEPWDKLPQSHRDRMMDAQRAAIEAMKIPTRKMTIAAEKMGAGEAWAEDCFAAMIDAALEETD